MDLRNETEISRTSYQWSARILSMLKQVLSVNIKMHHDKGQIASGEIFLFNHFARFETFIPQYLIYKETGDYCRSVAASDFFEGDDAFASYLLSIGAVPTKHQRFIPYLAEEILRGRKVIIFPEGGIVKDRRVQNKDGLYEVYSRSAHMRRKHHKGAAVLSLSVDILKQSIRQAFIRQEHDRLSAWVEKLGFEDTKALYEAAQRPSTIVPANITFYPMRVGGNLLHRGVELFNRGISRRLSEELLIEGNILLKNTDMDIRLGDIIYTERCWKWWEQPLVRHLSRAMESLDDIQAPVPLKSGLGHRFLAAGIRKSAIKLRNRCMYAMYTGVTINLSHLASLIIFQLLEQERHRVGTEHFRQMLYLAVKYVQAIPSINLHRSLENPEAYAELATGNCEGLDQFFRTAAQLKLIEIENAEYQFLPKLRQEHDFDEVRLENVIEVYANEAQPIDGIAIAISRAIHASGEISGAQLAHHAFNDQIRSYHWDRQYFSKPRYRAINDKETATASAEPFLLLPGKSKSLGVVLCHGFLASPAEMTAFGQRLSKLGYPVIGPRLKGHGTSPWDLRERHWQEWLDSVRQNYRILSAFCEQICLVGFSSGGALSLLLAAEQPDCLVGAVAVSVPLKFQEGNRIFVPLAHHANKLMGRIPSYEGIIPFRTNNAENSDFSYHSIPEHSLFEQRLMLNMLGNRLADIHCPTLLLQADQDPIVDPHSAEIILGKIGAREKSLQMIETERHSILYENIGNTQERVIRYLASLEEKSDVDSKLKKEQNQRNNILT